MTLPATTGPALLATCTTGVPGRVLAAESAGAQ